MKLCYIPALSTRDLDHFYAYDPATREATVLTTTTDGQLIEAHAVPDSWRNETRATYDWFVRRQQAHWLDI